jgi:hypothetical protein
MLNFKILFTNWQIFTTSNNNHIESASSLPSEFWCLNDKMIKELMSFAKCEIGKKVLWLCWSYSFIKTYVLANLIAHFECHKDKKNFIKWERREQIDHVCLMSIVAIKYIQDMKTYSQTSTFVTPGFKAKTICSSYVCLGSRCHTNGQNVNIENQCIYYIVSYYRKLLQVQKGISSGKDTILPQADDWGFHTPRRSLHQSTPHLLSSRS